MVPSRLLFLLAIVAGSSVATIYLNQPLLGQLAVVFGESPARTGLISMCTQIGYGLGIFLLVPLGDTLNRRKLVFTKLILLGLTLGLAGAAGSLNQFLGLSLVLGILATVAQDMVVLTADLASPAARGKAIGTVMSGLFMGVLISRTFSGVVAEGFGWRAVFWIAAAAQFVSAGLLLGFLPRHAEREPIAYATLIKSMIAHIRRQPALRRAVLTHGLVGMAFSAFWTCLAFRLSSPEFGLSTAQIGYFGLVGAAGTFVAPFAGRMVDVRGPFTGVLSGTALAALSFAGMRLRPQSIAVLATGAFLFDMGLQISLISHQTIVYALDHRAMSRLNAIFFTGIFVAFAVGSAIAVQIYGRYGWDGVLGLATALGSLAFLSGWRASRLARR